MHSVLETPIFTRRADALLSPEERMAVISALASDPWGGEEMPGTGGIRKRRFALSGRGKRGGARVIYYVLAPDIPIYALLIYAKNEQVDLTAEQRKALIGLVEELKAAHRAKTRAGRR